MPWRESILTMVKQEVEKLKHEIQPKQTKSIFFDPAIKSYLEALHKRLFFVTIDKAANKFAFFCKNYYISELFAKIGCLTQNLKHIRKLRIASSK